MGVILGPRPGSGGGGGEHPDLATHNTMGLATDAELGSHGHAHSATTGITADDHHNRDHTVTGSTHTASGLTSGHVLRASGATTFAFAAIQDGDLPSTIARDSEVTAAVAAQAETIGIAVSDGSTAITTGTSKEVLRMPFAMTLTGVRANLRTASTSGVVTVDINEGGTSVLSTKLTIDQDEKTSVTAATPAVISDSALADDAEITIDIDTAGTGAVGLKVWLIGTRA